MLLRREDDLGRLAGQVASHIGINCLVFLSGDVGVGKTAFVRYLVGRLLRGSADGRGGQIDISPSLDVQSPTFLLQLRYAGPGYEIRHFDLHRLETDAELEEIGLFEELANTLSLVEWPERAAPYLRKPDLWLRFYMTPTRRWVDVETNWPG